MSGSTALPTSERPAQSRKGLADRLKGIGLAPGVSDSVGYTFG